MSMPEPLVPTAPPGPLESLRKAALWMLVLGIALIVLGALAITASFIATLATVILFGTLFLIGAVIQMSTAFWARQWQGFFLHLLAGVLYLIVGLIMIEHPLRAAAALTILVAAALLVGGLFRIILALSERFPGWGWVLINGVITLVLGVLIWREWPESAVWVIGMFVGIDMIFSGLSWLMLGLAIRASVRQ